MATQEQVNELQANLLAAETAYRQASLAIMTAAGNESSPLADALSATRNNVKSGMKTFHDLAAIASTMAGITPQSVGPGKEDD